MSCTAQFSIPGKAIRAQPEPFAAGIAHHAFCAEPCREVFPVRNAQREEGSVRFVATEPNWLEATFVDRGSGYEQLEDAPEYKA